jgi:hypothetical protein
VLAPLRQTCLWNGWLSPRTWRGSPHESLCHFACALGDEDANGEFWRFSKFQKWTIQRRHVKRTITLMRGTDLGIYEYAR